MIGNYRILKKIGAGGMARVYLAVHRDVPNLKVVLKVLTDPRLADRFRQEADKLALLDGQASICQIKHFFNHGDDFVIAMEYIDGITLDDKIRESGRIPVAEAVGLIAGILDVLEVAHTKDIFHRDIKPTNIMLDKNDQIKIIDFGIAKGKSDPNLTVTGTSCGTPAYMAPEQFTPTDDIDYARIDIYAVGTMLYYMTTGELPFKGDNEFAVRDAKLFGDPPPPRKLNPDLPKPLETVILKAIRKEPAERYDSARRMRQALTPLIEKSQKASVAATKSVSKAVSTRKKSRLLPTLAIIAISLLMGVVAILKFLPGENSVAVDDNLNTSGENPATAEPTPVEPKAAPGLLAISIDPRGDLYLDDDLIGAGIAETTLTRDSGQYTVRIENGAAMNKTILDTISLAAGQQFNRRYRFEMPPPPAMPKKPAYGTVVVGSIPRDAAIAIDGRPSEYQTPYTFTLETGRRIVDIDVELDGRLRRFTDTVQITANDTVRVFFNAEE